MYCKMITIQAYVLFLFLSAGVLAVESGSYKTNNNGFVCNTTKNKVSIGNEGIKLVFERSSGKLNGIISAKCRWNFISQATDGRIWEIILCPPKRPEKKVKVSNLDIDGRFKIITNKMYRYVKLVYSGRIKSLRGVNVDVVLTFTFTGDELHSWIDVSVEGNYVLWAVIYPVLQLGPIGNPEDDIALAPGAGGRVCRNPTKKVYFGCGFVSNGMDKDYGNEDVGFETGMNYPSCRGEMQWVAYCEHKSKYIFYTPNESGKGLMLWTKDGAARPKKFLFYNDKPNELTLRIFYYVEGMGIDAKEFHQSAPTIITPFIGDWFTAVEIYREWALKQVWAFRGPVYKRTDIPNWFKNTDMRVMDYMNHQNAVGEISQKDIGVVREYNVPIAVDLYCWQNSLNEKIGLDGPNQAPWRWLPAIKGVSEAIERAKQITQGRIYFFPYLNAVSVWADKSKEFKEIYPELVKDIRGHVVHYKHRPCLIEGICSSAKLWPRIFAIHTKRVLEELGADGLYLDQIDGGAQRPCFDPTHPHKSGKGYFIPEGQRRFIITLKNEIGWNVPIITEAPAEVLIDLIAGRLVHYDIWPTCIPLFQAVYHDYIISHAHHMSDFYPDEDPGWWINATVPFVYGKQLGRFWFWSSGRRPAVGDLSNPKSPFHKKARFLKAMLDCREVGRKFLTFGQMLRPPILLSELPTVYTDKFWGGRFGRITVPAVLASLWKSPDGKVGLVVCNCSDSAQNVKLKLHPNISRIEKFIQLVGNFKSKEVNVSNRVFDLILPSHAVGIFVAK